MYRTDGRNCCGYIMEREMDTSTDINMESQEKNGLIAKSRSNVISRFFFYVVLVALLLVGVADLYIEVSRSLFVTV